MTEIRTAPLMIAAVVSLGLGVIVAQYLPSDLLGLRQGAGDSEESAMEPAGGDQEQLWTCGMHPHVIESEPGQCPICAMDLTPMEMDQGHEHHAHDAAAAETWTCPDHAIIQEDSPGTCPIDGLDLVRTAPPAPDVSPPPVAAEDARPTVTLDPGLVQSMNVQTRLVERRDLTRPIRTVGYLEFDQQRMVTVTTKYSGWIERVSVNYVGERVNRGEALFEIYSPELVQTEQELLSALDFAREMEGAPEDARRRAWSMVESARTRLGYWDITPEQIARLEETGEVFRTLEVAAPAGGVVMRRMRGLEGMAVQPGMELFHIADLSSLWLSVELFEDQIAAVREGTEATIDLSYFPGETFRGRVRFLEPELSEETRTLRAKIEVPNRSGRLRKGMYATVELQPVEVRDALAVPLEAVLRTGQRNAVVLAHGGGRFEPRDITLGQETGGFVQVLAGLDDGDRVVTSAQFLIDSESTLREAVLKIVSERRDAQGRSGAADPHAEHDVHAHGGHGAHGGH
ncbi:MAG: efflux RND transporter periplasmic adaptor subunit [Acidobacteriota bacterium]